MDMPAVEKKKKGKAYRFHGHACVEEKAEGKACYFQYIGAVVFA
jgi:hypothetical protein